MWFCTLSNSLILCRHQRGALQVDSILTAEYAHTPQIKGSFPRHCPASDAKSKSWASHTSDRPAIIRGSQDPPLGSVTWGAAYRTERGTLLPPAGLSEGLQPGGSHAGAARGEGGWGGRAGLPALSGGAVLPHRSVVPTLEALSTPLLGIYRGSIRSV